MARGKRTKKLRSPTEVLLEWESLQRNKQTSQSARAYAKKAGMKSIAEVRCAAWLERNNVPYDYEAERWTYQYEPAHYTPDFTIQTQNFVIEVKGKMTPDIRKKMLAVKRCNPDRKVYMVFERSNNRIAPGSRTTYGEWCEKNGIQWSEHVPRGEWFNGAKRKRKKHSGEEVLNRGGGVELERVSR